MIRLKWFKKKNEIEYPIINEDKVLNAIHQYRKVGKDLMEQLGRKFNLDISKPDDYQKLISRNNPDIPRKGQLSNRWNYYFHGCECGFYNKKHQQRVEVVLTNPPRFGQIDSWFLLDYMKTTDNYKNELKGINWQELKLVVDKLISEGKIQKIT